MSTAKPFAWFGAAALLLALSIPAGAVTDADRMAVYKEFRTQFDSRQYAAAKPLAEKLVQLTQEQYGAEELQVSTPLTNLATVDYKLGDFPAAIDNYQHALRILQSKSTMADKAQIRPLHGLGVSFMGANDPESAVVALKRAADLSRNTEGLFNINQVEFIDTLIDAYEATGRYAEAEKESMYAMRVEEATYGRASVKLLPRLDKLARWYEADRRYTSERNVYERSLAILQRGAPKNDLLNVGPLRGIGRSYRLETFYGVEGVDTGGTFNAANNGAPVFAQATQERRGESVLTSALDIIDANTPVDLQLRGEVLTDLGDWYLISNATRRAFDSYADAWKALAQVNNTKALEVPRILALHPSISSIDRSQIDPSQAVLKTVELHFKVDRDGRIDDVTSPTTDVPDMVVKNSISAMKRGRFAPRIENGAAVPTEDVVYVERVLVKATSSPDTAPASGTEAQKAPAAEKPEQSAPATAPVPGTPAETEKPAEPKPEQKKE
ncbi:MAG TPA: tetratricopeptide repeat protein [Steroidobacteraceae bacterium]|jgi:tetratricopeptide (TPR) repeat protein|nr:tetratricopeptide repeat protein [Steroidobacteraceae bacterium]